MTAPDSRSGRFINDYLFDPPVKLRQILSAFAKGGAGCSITLLT